MDAFTEKASSLGPDHTDYVCNARNCSWHKVVHVPTGRVRAFADLREHYRKHQTVVMARG